MNQLLHSVVHKDQERASSSSSFGSASPSPDDTIFPMPIHPEAIPVRGIDDRIDVKLASDRDEWEEAFRLVAENYRARGYEANSAGHLRFTNYHALPDTTVFVAKRQNKVVATLSLVFDSPLLGLPMECIFREEITRLREQGLRLVEVSSLADRELPIRQFIPVFAALTGLMTQWGIRKDADLWVISVNPRHRAFYQKMMGFRPLGPSRSHPSVLGHPAEAYMVNPFWYFSPERTGYRRPTQQVMDMCPTGPSRPSDMYARMLGEEAPEAALGARRMPTHLNREFARSSSVTNLETIEAILNPPDRSSRYRRWRDDAPRTNAPKAPIHMAG